MYSNLILETLTTNLKSVFIEDNWNWKNNQKSTWNSHAKSTYVGFSVCRWDNKRVYWKLYKWCWRSVRRRIFFLLLFRQKGFERETSRGLVREIGSFRKQKIDERWEVIEDLVTVVQQWECNFYGSSVSETFIYLFFFWKS